VRAPWTTICDSTGDVLAPKVPSPEYEAVSEWLPPVRLEVVRAAVPALSATEPREVVPS
jgi:hypothetical protein